MIGEGRKQCRECRVSAADPEEEVQIERRQPLRRNKTRWVIN